MRNHNLHGNLLSRNITKHKYHKTVYKNNKNKSYKLLSIFHLFRIRTKPVKICMQQFYHFWKINQLQYATYLKSYKIQRISNLLSNLHSFEKESSSDLFTWVQIGKHIIYIKLCNAKKVKSGPLCLSRTWFSPVPFCHWHTCLNFFFTLSGNI